MAVKAKSPGQAGIPDIGANYVPQGGMPLYVGGKNQRGEDWNWQNAATHAGMSASDLVRYNYRTNDPEVVNFYLQRNCGCKLTTADGKNFRFPSASPGIIYIPEIPPILAFYRIEIRPMEMLPTSSGQFEMAAVFQINLNLNPKLPDPGLYEYRQEISGTAFRQAGRWDGDVWHATGALRSIGHSFKIPGVPVGLQPYWQEDGVVDQLFGNRHYGHRENGNFEHELEVDRYRPGPLDGYHYICVDRPGLDGFINVGERTSLNIKFIGSVVRFDRPPGAKSRRIVETVAKLHWSYSCARTVKFDSPLVPIPS